MKKSTDLIGILEKFQKVEKFFNENHSTFMQTLCT